MAALSFKLSYSCIHHIESLFYLFTARTDSIKNIRYLEVRDAWFIALSLPSYMYLMRCRIFLRLKHPEPDWQTRLVGRAPPFGESYWHVDRAVNSQVSWEKERPWKSCWKTGPAELSPDGNQRDEKSSLHTGLRSQRCCSELTASPTWWCWAECRAPWGSLQEHTAERKRQRNEPLDQVSLEKQPCEFSHAVMRIRMGLGVAGRCIYEPLLARWKTPVAVTCLFHAVTIEHINIASRSAHKPEIEKYRKS